MDDLPIITLRRIEANVIKPIYDEMVATLGEEQARQILGRAIEQNAIQHGRGYAEREPEGGNDLLGFARLLPQWQKDDALEIEILESTSTRFDFDVSRCAYAEMYAEIGVAEIGDLLSCGRDGAFCTGYNPEITMQRTQTRMQGAPHCDFRYAMAGED